MDLEIVSTVKHFLSSNVAIVLTTSIILFYLYIKRNKFDYWEKQGVNGPKPLPIVGNAWVKFLKPICVINKQRYSKYGSIFGFYEKSRPVLSVADPEIVRHILVKDSDVFLNRRANASPSHYLNKMLTALRDEKWKEVRSIVSPAFSSGRIKRMSESIILCIDNLLENVKKKVEANKEIDIKELYGAYTIDVIALCAFATKTNAHKNPNDPFVYHAKLFSRPSMWRALIAFLVPKFLLRLTTFNLQDSLVMDFFETATKAIIRERLNKNVYANDFLQLLLNCEKTNDLSTEINGSSEHISSENQKNIGRNAQILSPHAKEAKLSEEEVIAQSLLFFIAGYETTTALLSFSSYVLALNPEKQELLYKEVKDNIEIDKEITCETVIKMKYLHAVISETLRMYSPNVRLEREVSRDYRLPNSDIKVPKGALVQIPINDIHHDKNYFPDPESFKPERFLPENVDQIKPYTYLPFGSGPRRCIGMQFALVEAKLALCNIILRYKIVKSENTNVPLKMARLPNSLLICDHVFLRMEKR